MEGDKRKHSSNWTEQEKRVLLSLVGKRMEVVENKCLSTAVTLRKEQAWQDIYNDFFMRCGDKKHSIHQLKEQWKRMKANAEYNLLKHKKDPQLDEAGSSTMEENKRGTAWNVFASFPSEFSKDNSESGLDTITKNKVDIAPSSPIPGTSTLDPLSSSLDESTNNEHSNESETVGWGPPTNGHHRKGSLPRYSRMSEYDREMMQLYREKHAMQMRHEEELHQENIQKAKLEQKKLMLEVQLLEKQLRTTEN